MNKSQAKKYEARAKVIKALGHPARLLIVDMLKDGPRCVCELRDEVGSDISTVSKHLSVLKNAGIVEDERRGLQVFYSLKMKCVTGFFTCVENAVRERAAALSV